MDCPPEPGPRLSLAIMPGLLLATLLSGLAWVLAVWAGFPAIISALVIGLCCSPLMNHYPKADAGVTFAAHPLMKIAVACLGAGVNVALLMALGWPVLMAVVVIMSVTILCGLWLGRSLGRTPRFAMLSAGAVAICGSSAALALCCALPASKTRERDLSAVIIGVSILSALGMLLYPALTQWLGLNDIESGFVIGGSLHNVAQAIAAGYIVSDAAGETATLVKMIRVSLLVPCVMLVAYAFRSDDSVDSQNRFRAFPPAFLVVFLLLMIAGSANLIPDPVQAGLAFVSKAGLILAMTAIGLSTPVGELLRLDRRVVLLMILQTALMLGGVLAFLPVLSL